MKTTKKELTLFFEEKNLAYQVFDFTDSQGFNHIIDSEFIIDIILNHTGGVEQKQIQNVIVKLDFHNRPILPFLEHLAKGYVETRYNVASC